MVQAQGVKFQAVLTPTLCHPILWPPGTSAVIPSPDRQEIRVLTDSWSKRLGASYVHNAAPHSRTGCNSRR